MSSIERRLARFLANERIVVPLIWKLFLEQVLTPFRGQQLYFVLDNSHFRDELKIVYLGLLVHSRVYIAGCKRKTGWVRTSRSNSSREESAVTFKYGKTKK
jgi:hypothetical protein